MQLLVPEASFWGHLCGILAGLLHVLLTSRLPLPRGGRGGGGGGALGCFFASLFGGGGGGRRARTYGHGTWGGGASGSGSRPQVGARH